VVRRGSIFVASAAAPSTPLTIVSSVPFRLWVRADLGITIGTGVSAWADQSGNGNSFTQGTGGSQPTLTAADATLNNLPSVGFDGVDDTMQSALALAAPGTTPFFIWGICKQRSWTGNESLVSGSGALLQIAQNTASPGIAGFDGTVSPVNNALAVNAWGRLEASFQNTAADYVRLIATTVTGIMGNSANTSVNLGARGGTILFADCAWAELFITLGTPSVGERAALDAYVTARYGAGLV
jgi:hypothetical protein